jgi:hypothetical protein
VRKLLLILSIVLVINVLLSACATSKTDAPVQAVEDYWNAIAAKDSERLPTLVCGDWETEALTVLDSLQAVTAKLDNFSCAQTGTDGDTTLVKCTGKMLLTYNTENQEIDLSTFTYQVVQQNGEWLVCGTR